MLKSIINVKTNLKKMKQTLLILAIGVCLVSCADQSIEEQEVEARDLLKSLDVELHERNNKVTEASWAYASNITDFNLQKQNEASAEHAKYLKVIFNI